jgi:hypothetical protein
MIGVGAAAGIVVCSPRMFGKKYVVWSRARRRDGNGYPFMLFFLE